mgnify:CR=1 FL=1
MLNNFSFILKNKYFFVMCFYLKRHTMIYETLFIGYKYNYLILNVNILIKTLKQMLNIIRAIAINNGEILFLSPNNKILDYILKKNCLQTNSSYLAQFQTKQTNLFSFLQTFPDLVISLNYHENAIFLNKLANYNVPIICITNFCNRNLIKKLMYTIIINNTSIYTNLLIYYLIFNQILQTKKTLGVQLCLTGQYDSKL